MQWTERKERAVLVRYEDVVNDELAVLHRIFAHIGVDSSEEVVAEVMRRGLGITDGRSGAASDVRLKCVISRQMAARSGPRSAGALC